MKTVTARATALIQRLEVIDFRELLHRIPKWCEALDEGLNAINRYKFSPEKPNHRDDGWVDRKMIINAQAQLAHENKYITEILAKYGECDELTEEHPFKDREFINQLNQQLIRTYDQRINRLVDQIAQSNEPACEGNHRPIEQLHHCYQELSEHQAELDLCYECCKIPNIADKIARHLDQGLSWERRIIQLLDHYPEFSNLNVRWEGDDLFWDQSLHPDIFMGVTMYLTNPKHIESPLSCRSHNKFREHEFYHNLFVLRDALENAENPKEPKNQDKARATLKLVQNENEALLQAIPMYRHSRTKAQRERIVETIYQHLGAESLFKDFRQRLSKFEKPKAA